MMNELHQVQREVLLINWISNTGSDDTAVSIIYWLTKCDGLHPEKLNFHNPAGYCIFLVQERIVLLQQN